MVTWLFQWPLALLIDDRYRPIDDIGQLKGLPLLLIHSRSDTIIPFHHGERLHGAAQKPKTFWGVENTRHIATFRNEVNQDRLVKWLESIPCLQGQQHPKQSAHSREWDTDFQ